MSSPRLGRLARLAMWIFALSLLASAYLKARVPGPAVAALGWTEWSFELRSLVVHTLTVAEAVVGALVLFVAASRLVAAIGAATAAVLIVGHGTTLLASDAENCGCFGDLPIPDAPVFGLLALGLVGCGASLLLTSRAPLPRVRLRLTLVLIATAAALVPFGFQLLSRTTPIEDLVRRVEVDEDIPTLLMVGSWSCPHCQEVFGKIAAVRDKDVEWAVTKVMVVKRRSDPEAQPPRWKRPWLGQDVIPDQLWWRLIRGEPPTYVMVSPWAEPARLDDWKQATQDH